MSDAEFENTMFGSRGYLIKHNIEEMSDEGVGILFSRIEKKLKNIELTITAKREVFDDLAFISSMLERLRSADD